MLVPYPLLVRVAVGVSANRLCFNANVGWRSSEPVWPKCSALQVVIFETQRVIPGADHSPLIRLQGLSLPFLAKLPADAVMWLCRSDKDAERYIGHSLDDSEPIFMLAKPDWPVIGRSQYGDCLVLRRSASVCEWEKLFARDGTYSFNIDFSNYSPELYEQPW